ncbi:hypothetical protein [Celeribacter sp.]|uniref:hypothetical protein n=1 Tax=Celeribacter sp. TaxID=1890673 RepID=UPI003A950DA8
MKKLVSLAAAMTVISNTAFAQSMSEDVVVDSATSAGGNPAAMALLAALFLLALTSSASGGSFGSPSDLN